MAVLKALEICADGQFGAFGQSCVLGAQFLQPVGEAVQVGFVDVFRIDRSFLFYAPKGRVLFVS